MKKAIALYTGGKDSHYAIVKALQHGVKVEALVTAVPRSIESWMFHAINIEFVKLHAQAMNMPIYMFNVSAVKEREVKELLTYLKHEVLHRYSDVDFIISGATASQYQKERVDRIAEELGLKHFAPLWRHDPMELLSEETSCMSFIIVAVQAMGLSLHWLGRVLTHSNLRFFIEVCRKFNVNPVGEGGEIETFVISSPLFHGHFIKIHSSVMKWYPEMCYGYYIIRKASIT